MIGLVLVTLLAVLTQVGFPATVRDPVLRRFNANRKYIVDVRSVRFRLPFGIVLDHPRMYRRGVVGPPLMEAERVFLRIHPTQWRHRRSGIRLIRINRGTIRRFPSVPDDAHAVAAWHLPDGEQGRIEWRQVTVTGLALASGTIDYRVEDDWLWMKNGQTVLDPEGAAGAVSGYFALNLAERRYTGQAAGTVDPRCLTDLTIAWDQNLDHLLERLDFDHELPVANLQFSGQINAPNNTFQGSGQITATRFAYHGVPVAAAKADGTILYDATQSRLDIRQVAAVLNDGIVAGSTLCDFASGLVVVDLNGTTSPLTPLELLGLRIPEGLRQFSFDGPRRWRAQGPVAYRQSDGTALQFGGEGQQVTFENYFSERLMVTANYDGHRIAFTEVDVALLNGSAKGTADVDIRALQEAPPWYRFNLKLEQIDFRQLIAASTQTRNLDFYEGQLSASLQATGPAVENWLAAMQATGQLRIRRGRLFRLPLFGGLSQILSRVIPGLDVVLLQTSAQADFSIANNRLSMPSARIEGDVFNVEGRGVYDFGGNLDFQAQLKLLDGQTLIGTVVRVISFPISKLFEFRLHGTLDKPQWYPVNFSSDLLERLRGLID